VILLKEYFQKPHTMAQEDAAQDLLARVEALRKDADAAGIARHIDPDTGCDISGSTGGDGDGGFRTPASTTGAKGSAHRDATAVDVYDPDDRLDAWITDAVLLKHGLYREATTATAGWCHLQTRATTSRTFQP